MKQFLALALVIGWAACSRPEGFHQVKLSADDVVAIYKVPAKEAPAMKFEWDFPSRRYVQLVAEQAPTAQGPWRTIERRPYGVPLTRAYLVFKVDPKSQSGDDQTWEIATRIGGNNETARFWSEGQISIPSPGREFETVTDSFNPAPFYTIRSKRGIVRFKFESSPQPFADSVKSR